MSKSHSLLVETNSTHGLFADLKRAMRGEIIFVWATTLLTPHREFANFASLVLNDVFPAAWAKQNDKFVGKIVKAKRSNWPLISTTITMPEQHQEKMSRFLCPYYIQNPSKYMPPIGINPNYKYQNLKHDATYESPVR